MDSRLGFLAPRDATSWVPVPEGSDFPVQNLPFGRVRHRGATICASRIGDHVVHLDRLRHRLPAFGPPLTAAHFEDLREALFGLLTEEGRDVEVESALIPIAETRPELPVPVTAYADFYAGIHHAANVGRIFRPNLPPLLPHYRHLPLGYWGAHASVVPSGTEVARPSGIVALDPDAGARFGPTAELDFELELAVPIGEDGELLGFGLLNDWSARDIQRTEYQPLGPFLGKSFCTSLSPWLVSPGALAPFVVPGMVQVPAPLPHLHRPRDFHFALELEVWLRTPAMAAPEHICQSDAQNLYWTFDQLLAHAASNGNPLRPGDLYASGTISGEEPGTYGSLLELSWGGQKPIQLSNGERRTFLLDGDEVILRGFGEANGLRIGFGELRNRVTGGRP